jgi:hypothetical protein
VKVKAERLKSQKERRALKDRKKNEKLEKKLMRVEDYDVTDFLAGMLDLTESIDEEDEESEVMFDDESFFEAVPEEPSKDAT